ncbi:hypothetical protein [Burkholderia ubonensis]|uniref:hypothetical protein n=2 Tax=Burkholderia ubonensis TaxID=101571 RepID=UPI0018DF55E0|nr:hypothetical protein [Burkholderia ubonensis]
MTGGNAARRFEYQIQRGIMQIFIAIIGGRNAGKSTIIKSLTGCPSGQYRGSVQDLVTKKSIEVIGSSPQEQAMSRADLRAILKRAAGNALCNGIVCALQPKKTRTRLSMEDVLQEALAYGFKVHAYVLDPDRSGSHSPPTVLTQLKTAQVKVRTLDARRFAQINAATINKHTKIAS